MRIAPAVAITVWTLARPGEAGSARSPVVMASGQGSGSGVRSSSVSSPPRPWSSPSWNRSATPALIVFSVFTVVLWIRSLIVNRVGDGSLPFDLADTVPSLGFFALAWWTYVLATFGTETMPEPEAASSSQDSLL